jgi:acetylornithine deacetylase
MEQWLRQNTNAQVERLDTNLIVRVAGTNHQKCLVFNGHTDTVQAGNPKDWLTDPLALTAKDGKLYGLGASDMKGADAVLLSMLAGYRQTPPPCDVCVMFVCQEETTGAGTQTVMRHIQEKGVLQDYTETAAVVGESTSLGVVLGHRGNVFARLTFTGKGGHGSSPAEASEQAILRASNFITSIGAKTASWNQQFSNPILGTSSVTVTQLNAGSTSAVNQVPTAASLTLDVRTTPEFHGVAPAELAAWAGEHGATLEILSESPSAYCDPSEALAAIAMQLVGQQESRTTKGSTDMCFLTQDGIPTIICGPGTRDAIHAPNEYVEQKNLDACLALYCQIAQRWAEQDATAGDTASSRSV